MTSGFIHARITGGPLDGQVLPIHGVGKWLRWPESDDHDGRYKLVSLVGDDAYYEWQTAPSEQATR